MHHHCCHQCTPRYYGQTSTLDGLALMLLPVALLALFPALAYAGLGLVLFLAAFFLVTAPFVAANAGCKAIKRRMPTVSVPWYVWLVAVSVLFSSLWWVVTKSVAVVLIGLGSHAAFGGWLWLLRKRGTWRASLVRWGVPVLALAACLMAIRKAPAEPTMPTYEETPAWFEELGREGLRKLELQEAREREQHREEPRQPDVSPLPSDVRGMPWMGRT